MGRLIVIAVDASIHAQYAVEVGMPKIAATFGCRFSQF